MNYEAFVQELEAAGVDEVRARILNNQYAKVSPKRDVAQDWLNRKEMEHQRERKARADGTASRASDAAGRSADAADRAAAAPRSKPSKPKEQIGSPPLH